MPTPDPSGPAESSAKPRRRRRSRSRSKSRGPAAEKPLDDAEAQAPAAAAPTPEDDPSPAAAAAADVTPAAGGKKKRSRRRKSARQAGVDHGTDENAASDQAGEVKRPDPARDHEQAPETATGILELANKSDGRLRTLVDTYVNDPDDPVVASHLIEKYNLRAGLMVEVSLGKAVGGGGGGGGGGKKGGKGKYGKQSGGGKRAKANAIAPTARRAKDVLMVDGMNPHDMEDYQSYEELTTIMPQPRLTLEYPGCPPACRLIDLFCPIGFGTRGMIVSPPKAGKTTLMQQIATAISRNHPEVEVYALLIDERPEEVTDFRRNVPCTVWASSNDHPIERHVGLVQLAIERCKRHAEMGKDVVVLLDSLTRVGRAFNTAPGIQGTGRTLSGGLDAGALAIPKQLFGGARKFEEGGSLTIIASALVDTGSRGDQVIFEEFKGTGNMEVILDRKIAETRTFPAIDLAASGTRNENLLMSPAEYDTVTALRRRLGSMQPVTQIDQLLKALQRYETNAEMVGDSQKNPQARG